MSVLDEAKMDRLRAVAERAFRSKHNDREAAHALKIFDRLCDSWGVATDQKNAIWRELELRYPDLDRRKALKRMARLLHEYVWRHNAVCKELKRWKRWSDEKIYLGPCLKLVEHVDLRAAKYLLSLKPDEFKTLYVERAKKKAGERSKRKKDGSTRDLKEKDVDQLVASDRKLIHEMCIEFIKGKGSVQRKYAFKAPKTFGCRFTRRHVGCKGFG